MPRASPAFDDDDELALASKAPTRERFKAALQRRYSPRIHMSLMLAASGMSAMLTSSSLLGMGVHSMLVRYPIAIALAYVTFLVGVWVWLRIMGYVDNGGHRRNAKSRGDGIDLPDLGSGGGGGGGGGSGGGGGVFRGGGGSFDGGGASQSFAGGRSSFVDFKGGGGSTGGGKGSSGFGIDGLDGDGIVLLLLALALVAAIFFTSGYLIWAAPDVLTEAAFGAMLTGTLVGATKRNTPNGWIGGVIRKTWWPFAIVMVVALVFTGYAATFTPAPSTFREAIAFALHQ